MSPTTLTQEFPRVLLSADQIKKRVLEMARQISNDFRGKTVTASREVTVVTQPPTVSVDSDQHYLYLGMADLVTFTVSWTYPSSASL